MHVWRGNVLVGSSSKHRRDQSAKVPELNIDFRHLALFRLQLSSITFMSPHLNIVLIHGWNSSRHAWRDTAGRLAEMGHNVFIPDIPSHGSLDSRSEALTDQLKEKFPDGETIHLIGHSMVRFFERHGYSRAKEGITGGAKRTRCSQGFVRRTKWSQHQVCHDAGKLQFLFMPQLE